MLEEGLAALREKRSALGLPVDARPLLDEVARAFDRDVSAGKTIFYVIRAPTGYGKTSLSQAAAVASTQDSSVFEKVIHVLPFRSIVDDVYASSVDLLGRRMVGIQRRGIGELGDPFLLAPLSVVTVDTFILEALKLIPTKLPRVARGEEFGYDLFAQSSVVSSMVVLDEAHVGLEDSLLREALATALVVLIHFAVPVVLMSATLTDEDVNRLISYARRWAEERGGPPLAARSFDVSPDDPFMRRELRKEIEVLWAGDSDPLSLAEPGVRNLVVVNSVRRAQRLYAKARREGKFERVILLHSRFTEGDRRKKVEALRSLAREENEWLVIATQVVEAGVDVSADVLVTELAPQSALIQRMGRVARWGEESGKILIVKPNNFLPYTRGAMEAAVEALSACSEGGAVNIHPRVPRSYLRLLEFGRSPVIMRHVPTLAALARDVFVRSFEMYSAVETVRRRHGFIREYPVELVVPGVGVVPVAPAALASLVRKRPGSVVVACGETRRPLAAGEIDEIREKIGASAAEGREVFLELTDPSLYDPELGLAWG